MTVARMQLHVNERDLLARVARGDADALDSAVLRYGQMVHETAARLLGSADDADDIVQEVFIGLPEAMHAYEERGRFEPWLRRLAARVALMHMRRRQRRASLLERFGSGSADVPPSDPDDRLDIDNAVSSLPESLRVVFVLKVTAGMSHGEIAQLLNIRRGTSEVRFHRAVRRLREILEDSA
jgi:RNA polymerase sigma-70 factor, ECF subfamily